MQSMQRQFGKLLHKSPGDNARISALLNDYEDADRVLAKLIEQTKTWRESWTTLMNAQVGIVTEYEGLYDPIEGSSSRMNGRPAATTPQEQLQKTFDLKAVYTDLRADLAEEIALIDTRIINPTQEARDCITPIRKTIKKRENRRLDYENAQAKAAKLQRKIGKTPKEDAALSKAETEVARLAEEFETLDNRLREVLPPVVEAAFSIMIPLLGRIVLIQNRLLGLYYTALHNYCEEHDFPSPPPPMEDVVATWSTAYDSARREFESISCIATGKAARKPLGDTFSNDSRMLAAPPGRNGFRRSSSGLIHSTPAPAEVGPPRPPRPGRAPSNPNNLGVPTEFTTASGYGNSPTGRRSRSPSPAANSLRPPHPSFYDSSSPKRPGTASSRASSVSNISSISAAVAKKKPPPPPPPKRIPSGRPEEFMIALYDFAGQGEGDLAFREGDRIKVVKKTETDQDWWQGELNGVRGSFPANYCRPA